MTYQKYVEAKKANDFSAEEQQEFLNLLSRMTPRQRDALKEVLKSFT